MKALKNGIKLATMARKFIHIREIAKAITEIISTKSFISLVFGFRSIRVHQTPECLLILNNVRKDDFIAFCEHYIGLTTQKAVNRLFRYKKDCLVAIIIMATNDLEI